MKEEIPLSLCSSVIIPLHKKGDANSPQNSSGLSLLDSIYKIFTGLLLNRLNEWVNQHNINNEFQAGFRKGYSTIDNIFNMSSIVHLNFNKENLYLFVDFSAAFDMIPRNSLFYKLCTEGLSRKMIVLLQKLYQNTNSQVWDGCSLSDLFEVDQGVSLYLNDLNDFLPGGINIGGSLS